MRNEKEEKIKGQIAKIVAEQDNIDKKLNALTQGHDNEWTQLMNERKALTKRLVVLQDELIDQTTDAKQVSETRSEDEIFRDMTNS